MSSQKSAIQNSEPVSFCTFYLAGRMFGVDILDIREIISEFEFTEVHHAPAILKGYVNIRGYIYLAADMRLIMGFEEKEYDDQSRMIVFKDSSAESFGVIVDRIGDIITIERSCIEDRRGKSEDVPAEIMERRKDMHDIGMGVCKLEKGIMIVVNSRSIFEKTRDLL